MKKLKRGKLKAEKGRKLERKLCKLRLKEADLTSELNRARAKVRKIDEQLTEVVIKIVDCETMEARP